MRTLNEETAKLDHFGKCPKCGGDWDAGAIFDVLRAQAHYNDRSDEQLREMIQECYGEPYRLSRLIGVQLSHNHPDHYDGVSFWECPDCHHAFPRFTK